MYWNTTFKELCTLMNDLAKWWSQIWLVVHLRAHLLKGIIKALSLSPLLKKTPPWRTGSTFPINYFMHSHLYRKSNMCGWVLWWFFAKIFIYFINHIVRSCWETVRNPNVHSKYRPALLMILWHLQSPWRGCNTYYSFDIFGVNLNILQGSVLPSKSYTNNCDSYMWFWFNLQSE